jgi:hypothetical protein
MNIIGGKELYRRVLSIGLVSLFIATAIIAVVATANDMPTHNPAPPLIQAFEMEFKDNDTYELFEDAPFTVTLIIRNVYLTPIYVTVSTDSPYCVGDNTTNSDRIGIDREVEVPFTFSLQREIGLEEVILLNFTGVITGDPVAFDEENLQATAKSGVILSASILEFQYSGEEKEGEDIVFSVKVQNDGNVPATVMVKIFDGKDEIDNNTKQIDVGGSDTIEVLWVAKEGKHTFQARAYIITGYVNGNPQNAPILLLADHHSTTIALDVESGGIIGGGGTNTFIIAAVVIAIIVIVIIIFIKRDKIKKKLKGKK